MRFSFKKLILIFLCAGSFSFSYFAKAEALNYEDYPQIKLRALDKITARAQTIDAKVGSLVKFGDVVIDIKACRKPPPIEKNEAAAFLEISVEEKKQAEQSLLAPPKITTSSKVFSGWMFASSPALSAMDHPIYDVWVIDCAGKDPEPLPPPEEQVEAKPAEPIKEEEPKNTFRKA